MSTNLPKQYPPGPKPGRARTRAARLHAAAVVGMSSAPRNRAILLAERWPPPPPAAAAAAAAGGGVTLAACTWCSSTIPCTWPPPAAPLVALVLIPRLQPPPLHHLTPRRLHILATVRGPAGVEGHVDFGVFLVQDGSGETQRGHLDGHDSVMGTRGV